MRIQQVISYIYPGEDVDSASSADDESEAEDEKEEEEEEVEDNPLIVKEKKERIDKTNLWFNKVRLG